MRAHATSTDISSPSDSSPISKIAAGVDGFPEGEDAVALAAALAGVTNADLLLVSVHSEPLLLVPSGFDWKSRSTYARRALRSVRDALAPAAHIQVEKDLSVAHGLHRVANRSNRDLLVMGSSRHASEGRVRIGKRTRQLLCHFECSLAVAPRGFRTRGGERLERIGAGYDGGPEAAAALALAGSLASAAGAELRVLAMVDDRFPKITWAGVSREMVEEWERAVAEEYEALRAETESAVHDVDANARVEIRRGRPGDGLLALSEEVDLLVIGSRRWGPLNRLLLGSTGETVFHDAGCPVVAVPRPPE